MPQRVTEKRPVGREAPKRANRPSYLTSPMAPSWALERAATGRREATRRTQSPVMYPIDEPNAPTRARIHTHTCLEHTLYSLKSAQCRRYVVMIGRRL